MGFLNEPFFPHNLILNSQQAFRERFRPWRASRNVDVNGDDLVHAFTNGIGELKKPAAAGAASHRDDVFRIGHLIVEELGALGHFISEGSCHDHQIRLPGRGARDSAESVDISARSSGLHQLDGAAGQAEKHVPLRRGSPPVKKVVYLRGKNGFW
jgi:hypothetical protein